MNTFKTDRKRRGAALLMTYFVALLLSFMVIYGYQSSVTSGTASKAVADTERADYIAEYAASLALSELPNVKRGATGKMTADWVGTNTFTDKDGNHTSDQRRIAGVADGYEFRVMVRSARDAYDNNTAPDNWLANSYENDGFVMGSSNDSRYSNTYEILSTSRLTAGAAGASRHTGSLYGVVEMPFGDNPGRGLEDYKVLNLDNNGQIITDVYVENPPLLMMVPGTTQALAALAPQTECYNNGTTIGAAGGVNISAEDHDLTTVFPKLTVGSGTKIEGAQRGAIAKNGRFVAATGGYWSGGNLTLNFMADPRGVDKDSIKAATTNRAAYTPARPNPHIPYSKGFNDNEVKKNPGHNDRQMTSKLRVFGNSINDFYNKDYYATKYNKKATPPKEADRWAADTLPVDQYFLGGKNVGGGRTVNFQDPDIYTRGYNALNDMYYKGKVVNGKYTGVIAEEKASQLTAAKPLDVIVGSYEDLKRFYITYCPNNSGSSWRTTFVGEWTDSRKKPGSSSTLRNMLFDNNPAGTPRRRSFSKHFPMNKEGKILVHEMEVYNSSSGGSTRPMKSSNDTSNVWTGRYRWAEVDFSGKFYWREKGTNYIVYPREFTWEEITGQKAKRMPNSDGGTTVTSGAATYRRDKSTGAFDPTPVANSVRIEGYPICDTIGREVPELDSDNNPIPIGLTEYCSVDANDPEKLIPVVFDTNAASAIDEFGVMTEVKATGKQNKLKEYKDKVRKFARRNYIEVVEGSDVKYYYDITDFEFVDTITWTDEDGVEHTEDRSMAAITVGIEDLDEAGSDYDYTDMMFILNVVPAYSTGPVIGENAESNRYIQWWVLDPEYGLTGGKSMTALSSTELPNTSMLDKDARNRINYEYIINNGNSAISANTFVTKVGELTVKYHRAEFDETGDLVVPDFDGGEREVYYYMAPSASDYAVPHYEKYDDLFAYLNIMTENPSLASYLDTMMEKVDEPSLMDSSNEPLVGNSRRKAIALLAMKSECASKGVKLTDISERIGDIGYLIDSFLYVDDDGDEKVDEKLYQVREERFTSRRMAGLIFGRDAVAVSVVNTEDSLDIEHDEFGAEVSPTTESLLFIGGELPPSKTTPVPFVNNTMIQPVGSPLGRVLPQGNVLDSLILVADDLTKDKADVVVDQLYEPLLAPADVDNIHSLFSIDDNRYQLGWRRSGNNLADAQGIDMLLDCYRSVMLTAKDIQPYSLAQGMSGITDFIAKVKTFISDGAFTGGDPIYKYLTLIDTYKNLPTFTFGARNGTGIDGAGVLVVNGNLHVNTDFSYYGLLVVLGDVVIEPKPGMYYAKDGSGNFLSADGDKIYRDSDGNWFRMAEKYDEDNVDEDGNMVVWEVKDYKDRNDNTIVPVMTEQYKGELTVQGQMLVGGNIKVKHVKVNDPSQCPPNIAYNGSLKMLGSESARQMIEDCLRDENGGEIGRFGVKKTVWTTHATNYVDHIWNNTVN